MRLVAVVLDTIARQPCSTTVRVQVCKALRLLGLAVPIIACTGNATASDSVRYSGVGFTAMLAKPFRMAELASALHDVVPTFAAVCFAECTGALIN